MRKVMGRAGAAFGGLLIFNALVFSACTADEVPLQVVDTTATCAVTYTQIQPMLRRYCEGCHGTGFPPDVSNYATLKAQYLDNGVFERRVITRRDMPSNTTLTAAEIDSIICWRDGGYPE
jgi:hypothetical protein